MSSEKQCAFSFEELLKECSSSLERTFSNLQSPDQSLQQIFQYDGNATGFMILLFNKNRESMGRGIFLERLKKSWSFPVVIDAVYSPPQTASNENLTDWNFMIVFKDQKPLQKFFNSGEIVLGNDCDIQSTTNASRISNNLDSLFIYSLKESNGLGLVPHLSGFRGMRIKLDKCMNEKQYGSWFSISKLSNLKLNANGDYERIIKLVNEKFQGPEMTNQQTITERVKETFHNATEIVQGLAQNLSNRFYSEASGNSADFLKRSSAEYHYTEPELERHISETDKAATGDKDQKGFPHTVENIYKTVIEPSGKQPPALEDFPTQSNAENQNQIFQKGQQLRSETIDNTNTTNKKQDLTIDQ